MVTVPKRATRPKLVDKAALRATLEAQDARTGFVFDPTVTPQQVRDQMLADGVRPEECEFTKELMRMRYEE